MNSLAMKNLKGFGILTCFVLFFMLIFGYFALLIYAVFPFISFRIYKDCKDLEIWKEENQMKNKQTLEQVKAAHALDSMHGRMFLRFWMIKTYLGRHPGPYNAQYYVNQQRHVNESLFQDWMIKNLNNCTSWNEFESFLDNLILDIKEKNAETEKQLDKSIREGFVGPSNYRTIDLTQGLNENMQLGHNKITFLNNIRRMVAFFKNASVEEACSNLKINFIYGSEVEVLLRGY